MVLIGDLNQRELQIIINKISKNLERLIDDANEYDLLIPFKEIFKDTFFERHINWEEELDYALILRKGWWALEDFEQTIKETEK